MIDTIKYVILIIINKAAFILIEKHYQINKLIHS